jgi:pimeloyl-ACP methyl ester carboxylesterase
LVERAKSLPAVTQVIECSYDWRDSVLNSCLTVANQIGRTLSTDLAKPPAKAQNDKVTLVAHSMGGLVVKAAIASELIHPGHIDRIVYIGCPQYGAPAAFRSMYSDVDLPFFSEFASLFRGLEKQTFRTHILRSFRTFPSISQLLPALSIDYICYSAVSRTNPLREAYMDGTKRQMAMQAQQAFRRADLIVEAAKIQTFAIYTATRSDAQTDHDYTVEAIAIPNGYQVVGVYHRDWDGDGTVPAYSAKGNDYGRALPVINCRHASMCESKAVFDWLVRTDGAASQTGKS